VPKIRTTPDLFANPRKRVVRKSRAKKKPGKKNPRPFGKRKASHQAFKRKKPAARKVFGRRKEALYVISGDDAKSSRYYFTGVRFDTVRAHAAFYRERATAVRILNLIRSRVPDQLRRSVEVRQA